MKNMARYVVVAVATLLFTTGCFKPDEDGSKTDLLEGYWEVVHITDNDYSYDVYFDGTQSEKEYYYFDSDVVCNDGQEEYVVLHISPAFMTMIATDSPDEEYQLNKSYPYTFKNNSIYSPIYTDYETNLEQGKVVELTETTLKVRTDEYDEYEPSEDEIYNSTIVTRNFYSRVTTFRRIQ